MANTSEQTAIIESDVDLLVVDARSGSGKTYTLVEYAKARPNESMIYLAFNKSIKDDAAKKFPSNVKCYSTHGLAFPKFGSQFQGKLFEPKATHISKLLGIDVVSAGRVLAIVNHYMTTAASHIEPEHVFAIVPNANGQTVSQAIALANQAWEAMTDPKNKSVPCPHDAYLKCYQLSNPIIRADVILFDESQDSNAVILDIVLKQKARKVLVGDKNQAIYGFRGAVNALAQVEADLRLNLTTSFRFGEGIAAVASALLQDWAGAKKAITGSGKYETVFSVDKQHPYAYLARTNGNLFGEAVSLLRANRPFGYAGGVEGYRLDSILNVYFLYCGQKGKIRDPYIASFKDYPELKNYATELDDKELKSIMQIVDDYLHEIPTLIEQIKAKAVYPLTGGEVILATGHKSKGLEFLDVVLGDDFTDLETRKDPKTGKMIDPDVEEINLLYVAITRALRGIDLPIAVREWLAKTGRGYLLQGASTPSVVVTAPTPVSTPVPPAVSGEQKTSTPQPAPTPRTPPHQLSLVEQPLTAEQKAKKLSVSLGTLESTLADILAGCEGRPEIASVIAGYLAEQSGTFAAIK